MADERCGRCNGDGWLTSWEDRVRCPECKDVELAEPPAPAVRLAELKAKMLRIFRNAGLRTVPIEQIPDLIEEIGRMTWAEADKEKAQLARRVAELEEDLANATGGFDAATGLADAEQERAKAAEQRVRDLEAALRRSRINWKVGNHYAALRIIDAALRGTGEGNRG